MTRYKKEVLKSFHTDDYTTIKKRFNLDWHGLHHYFVYVEFQDIMQVEVVRRKDIPIRKRSTEMKIVNYLFIWKDKFESYLKELNKYPKTF